METTKKVEVKNFIDLKKLIENIMAEKNASTITNQITVDMPSKELNSAKVPVSFKTEGSPATSKMISDGFDVVKRMLEFESNSSEIDAEDFEGMLPASPPPVEKRKIWIDKYLKKHLDAKREGLKIVWNLNDGKFALDPWSLKLTKLD